MQTLGIAEVPLLDADFIAQPRKIASLELPFFRPHAHGHLMKLAKASRSLLHTGTLMHSCWRWSHDQEMLSCFLLPCICIVAVIIPCALAQMQHTFCFERMKWL